MTPVPEMFDWDLRIRNMDAAQVDISVVSLTCPNVFWGGAEVSLKAARSMNDEFAKAQNAPTPTASAGSPRCPGSTPTLALAGAEARGQRRRVRRHGARQHRRQAAHRSGVRADLEGDRRRALPVLVHPTAPPGLNDGMRRCSSSTIASIGFTIDTTLAFSRMIFDGFFDRYQEAETDRLARRRHAPVPGRAARPVLRQHARLPRAKTREQAERATCASVYADAVVFQQDVLAHGVAIYGDRQRALRLGLPAHHRRHDRLPRARRCAAGRVRDKVRGVNARRIFKL